MTPARPDAATWAKELREAYENAPQNWAEGGISMWRVVAERALTLHAQAVAAVEQELNAAESALGAAQEEERRRVFPVFALLLQAAGGSVVIPDFAVLKFDADGEIVESRDERAAATIYTFRGPQEGSE
jgi:hypothetical protein